MNKFFYRLLYLLVISFVFANCATKSISDDFYKFEANGNGLIIGTVTFPKNVQWFDNYIFRLQDRERNKSMEFTINSYENVNDPSPNDKYTKKYVFVIERKPGKYEINNLRLFADNHDADGMIYHGKVTDFIIPIDVQKGQITYIGDIYCMEDLHNRSFSFNVTDTYEKDLRYFKKRSSLINWEKVTKSIVQPTY